MSRTSQEQRALGELYGAIQLEQHDRADFSDPSWMGGLESTTDQALEAAWIAYQARRERTAGR